MKTIVAIGSILILSYLILSVLMSNGSKETSHPFKRNYIGKAAFITNLETSEPIFNLCGTTHENYFFMTKDPRKIISAAHSLKKIDTIITPFPITDKIISGFEILVDSPQIYLFAKNLSLILSCKIGDTAASQFLIKKMAPPLFTRVKRLSPGSIVLRAFDSSRKEQIIAKINTNNGQILKSVNLHPNQSDAGFSTDGLLEYDSINKKIFYFQFYQNNFYCLDTSLNLIYIAKTIDTTNSNAIYTRNTANRKKGSIMPSVPLKQINKGCTIYDGKLFILSSLKSDNESNSQFNNNSVADSYDVTNGRYTGSLYIPNINGMEVRQIYNYNDTLLAVYPRALAKFKWKN